MSNINGLKKVFVENNLENAGTVAWRRYLNEQGYSSGSIVDDAKAYMLALGFWTGNMNESLYRLYLAYGEGIPQHNFDGIDDYIQLPTIELFTGDVVEFDFVANTQRSIVSNLIDGQVGETTLANRIIVQLYSNGTFILFNCVASIDGQPIISQVTSYPLDGVLHHMVCVVPTTTKLGLISRFTDVSGGYYDNVIKNLRITRSTPTDTHPNLFYPIDDGWDNNPVIRQTLSTVGNWDGTAVNFNESNWELV